MFMRWLEGSPMQIYHQKPNEIKWISLPGPGVNPDGRLYSVILLPSSYVAINSYTDNDRVMGQFMIEGTKGVLNGASLPGAVSGSIVREVFKFTVDQVTNIVKEQAIQGLTESANKDELMNACGFFTNRTGLAPLMAAAILCAYGGGKPLRYHNRVKADTNYQKAQFFVNQLTKLSVSYGLPLPLLGGGAELMVIGA
jgi:hypothetical protein